MSNSEILLKAAINRITARITEKIINSSQEFSEIAYEIPNRLQDEWSKFKDEVIEESQRLEKEKSSPKEANSNQQSTKEDLIQAKIDSLRSKVIEINKSIEERN